MQGLLNLLGNLTVGIDRHKHFRRFQANLEILEVMTIQDIDVAHGGLHQRVCRRLAIFALERLLQRTGVHTNANGNVAVPGRTDHGTDAVIAADIARIDPETVNTQFCYPKSDFVIEVDVGNQRQGNLLPNLPERLSGVHGRNGNTHYVRTCLLQCLDLANGGLYVTGFGVGHALHRNRRVTTHRNIAHHDLAGFASDNRGILFHVLLTDMENLIKFQIVRVNSDRLLTTR